MKASLLTLGFLLVCHATHAADLTLTDGRTFRDATVVSQTPRTVVIKHTNGLNGISKTLLPAALSACYPVDEAAAREADRQAAEARVRAQEFHKAEAERAVRVRLEREQAALYNAQIAALEATERLAEAEAARIANQRTEVVYEYVSFHRTPRYIYTPSHSRDCEPRRNENLRDNRFVREDRTKRHDRNSDDDRCNPRQNLANTQTVHRTHNQAAVPCISQTPRVEENLSSTKAAAVVVRY